MPPATRRRAARPTSSSTSFWHFYLREHARPLTRALHVAGTVGALTIATLAKLAHEGVIRPDERTVAIVSGHGLKTVEALSGHVGPDHTIAPTLDAFDTAVGFEGLLGA